MRRKEKETNERRAGAVQATSEHAPRVVHPLRCGERPPSALAVPQHNVFDFRRMVEGLPQGVLVADVDESVFHVQ